MLCHSKAEVIITYWRKLMKKILILNGSPRRNGATQSLINAFCKGSAENGNEIRECYIQQMNIKPCIGCDSCLRNHKGCVQKDDDMNEIYENLSWCDLVVFASPEFWGTITAQLKVVIDRMFAWFNKNGMFETKKECVLVMTARGNDYRMAEDQYGIFTKYLGWTDLGKILGKGKEVEAEELGKTIK